MSIMRCRFFCLNCYAVAAAVIRRLQPHLTTRVVSEHADKHGPGSRRLVHD
eukprot:CAMPEP_0119396146 /NCGR_PEP_ID=MMETSP1334-20130426/135824_1 /TAXON_ID=127549 /ORGANISM="Calcidiscus leptoporus, Strain RCC1130" /LENGTH=50 /DNA_ID=CAMNT_0007419761 /DNA_START=257 /DNA_END=406 /DNA_ORIENTATION=-